MITKELIESEYDLIGYTVLDVSNTDGKFRFGYFNLSLYDGPIYVEELNPLKRNNVEIRV
jgi:hypothetical protein